MNMNSTARNASSREKALWLALLAAGILPFLYWTFSRYINLDFWYDELTTLLLYVCVPLKKTATDYSFPNNHIFLNIISNIYLSVIDLHDLNKLVLNPLPLRLLMLFYAMLTMVLLYKIGKMVFDRMAGLVAVATLATTIPYYNFATQVRGYVLSMLLLTAYFYFYLKFVQSGTKRHFLLFVAMSALSIYTMPASVYIVACVIIYCFMKLLIGFVEDKSIGKASLAALVGSLASLPLAALFYWPVLKEVLNNRFVESQGMFNSVILTDVFPTMLSGFLSERYYIVPIILFGVVVFLFNKRSVGIRKEVHIVAFLVLVLPFAFSFIRGDSPVHRIYINIIPFFSLFVASSTFFATTLLPARVAPWVGILLIPLMSASFVIAAGNLDKMHAYNIENHIRPMDTYYNWHQGLYNVMDVARMTKDRQEATAMPVYVMKQEVDELSMPWYLTSLGVTFKVTADFDVIDAGLDRILIVTGFPRYSEGRLKELFPGLECRKLNAGVSFHNLLECDRSRERQPE